jgi:hypothetical protein
MYILYQDPETNVQSQKGPLIFIAESWKSIEAEKLNEDMSYGDIFDVCHAEVAIVGRTYQSPISKVIDNQFSCC